MDVFYKLSRVDGAKTPLTREEAIDFVCDDSVDFANHEAFDPETRQSFVILESHKTGQIYLMKRNG